MKFKSYLDNIDINDIVEEMMNQFQIDGFDNKKLKKKYIKSYAKRYRINEKRLQNAYEQMKKIY